MTNRTERSELTNRSRRGRVRRRTVYVVGLALVAFVAAPACGESGASSSNPDWPLGPDAGTPDAGAPEEPQSTTIRLKNEGSERVWFRPPRGACRTDPPGWVQLREDGEAREGIDSCDICNCESVRADETCGGCPGIPCRSGAQVNSIAAGEQLEWTWQGRFFRRDEVDGRSCEVPYIPSRGASLAAEVCWSVDPEVGGDSVQCETIGFEYGRDEVVKTVRPGANEFPVQTKFVLDNQSDRALEVTRSSPCRTVRKPWVAVWDGETEVDFGTDCTTCSCDDARSGNCAACERACVPSTTRLPSGESVETTWNDVGYRVKTVEGATCHEEWVPDVGEQLTARFCYHVSAPNSGDDKHCFDRSFVYGDEPKVEFEFSLDR